MAGQGGGEKSGLIIAAVIGAVAVIVAAIIGVAFKSDSNAESTTVTPPPVTTSSSSPTPSGTGPTSTDPEPWNPTGTSPTDTPPSTNSEQPSASSSVDPPAGPTYLADIEPIEGSAETGSSTIGGNSTVCPKSVMFNFGSYQPKRDPVTYGIPAGSQSFTATLGIDNRAKDGLALQFSVYVDDVYQNSYRLDLYSVQDIAVDVAGHSRLRLEIEAVGRNGSDMYYGRGTWGNARFNS